jgi:transposase
MGTVMIPRSPAPSAALPEQVSALREVVRWQELRIKDLETQLYGRKSEKNRTAPEQNLLLPEIIPAAGVAVVREPEAPVHSPATSRTPKGPRPLDPALPRESVVVAAPALKDLICPVSGEPRQPGFVEVLEVLARRPAQYYVKRYERTVFVSAAKTAPVCADWPCEVLARSRVHVSIVAHIAAAHFCEHQPYHRIEKHLERIGVSLPRSTQVSLMEQLNERVAPMVEAIRRQVWASGYVHLDATPIDLLDPGRPGGAREAVLWAYRAHDGPVWFEYRKTKTPDGPASRLADFRGYLQTDGATGLADIGKADQRIVHLSCWAHARRYFVKAVDAGELGAADFLRDIDKLFRLERELPEGADRQAMRERDSLPLADALFTRARNDQGGLAPKTRMGQAVNYLLGQYPDLRRCLSEPAAGLDNNPVERAIRALKIGAKNWLFIGHPDAAPRLACLFTLVENCRLVGVDPETYLVDLIARLPDHPNRHIDQLLPANWRAARGGTTLTQEPPPALVAPRIVSN